MGSSLKHSIYFLFFSINQKMKFNLVGYSIGALVETIQLISFSFSSPIKEILPLRPSVLDNLEKIMGSLRIAPLLKMLSFDYYIIIWGLFVFLLFLFVFFGVFTLTINNKEHPFFKFYTTLATLFFAFSWVLFIPFNETILVVFHCENGRMSRVKDGIECYKGLHIFYVSFTGFILIVNFIVIIVFEIFGFTPLDNHIRNSPQKISSFNSIISVLFKCIMLAFATLGKISEAPVVVMIIASLLIISNSVSFPTINKKEYEYVGIIRAAIVLWHYIYVLVIRIFSSNESDSHSFWFVIIGYPLAITIGAIVGYYVQNRRLYTLKNDTYDYELIDNINGLIDVFEDAEKEKTIKKSAVYLKGYAEFHLHKCTEPECPLEIYLNQDDMTIKKKCMLRHINSLFNEGLKKYPNSVMLMLAFVNFNYLNEYNANSVKFLLKKISNCEKTFTEEFNYFMLKEKIDDSSSKLQKENEAITIEGDCNRLKSLIEDTTKLYIDFWGNLSTTLISNLNVDKVFQIGKKIGTCLSEIKEVWEKSISSHPSTTSSQLFVINLYSLFLRNVLCNHRLSEEVSRKITNETAPMNKTNDTDFNHIEENLEKEEGIVICRAGDKGDCDIINMSMLCSHLLGYQKYEVMGKKIEVLMPSVFSEDDGHKKMMTQRLKKLNITKEKIKVPPFLVYPKGKNGYLVPVMAGVNICSENDFSNNYLIRVKVEPKEAKNSYAFYMVLKDDFTIESMTSSCIHLGLSNELAKKFPLELSNLIITENKERIDFLNEWKDYSEEPKEVYWVYPDLIYPNDDENNISKLEAKNIDELIHKSKKKLLRMMITTLQFQPDSIIGYALRFEDTKQNRFCLTDTTKVDELRADKSYSFIYNMKGMKIERFKLEKSKSTLHYELSRKKTSNISGTKDSYAPNSTGVVNDNSDDSSDDEKEDKRLINKDTLKKISVYNSRELDAFIKNLYFYGSDVIIGKHRPNKEIYYTDKMTEPLIRISISQFKHRIETKLSYLDLLKHKPNHKSDTSTQEGGHNDMILTVKQRESEDTESKNDVDEGSIISKLINHNTQKIISIFSIVYFSFNLLFVLLEFIFTFKQLSSSNKAFSVAEDTSRVTNSILYVHYFITETLLAQEEQYPHINSTTNKEYIVDMMSELRNYREIIHQTILTLNYGHFKEEQIIIFTLSNNEYKNETLSLQNALERLVTNIFYISTITDNYFQITIISRNAYEIITNCLNGYLMKWVEVNAYYFQKLFEEGKNKTSVKICYILSGVMQIIFWFVASKLIGNFVSERKKPIHLLLTVKRDKYLRLKKVSEQFLNSMLNKELGNDDIEHEQTSVASVEISSNDIVASKIKTEIKTSKGVKRDGFILMLCVQFITFIVIIEAYFLTKYLIYSRMCSKLQRYAELFNLVSNNEVDILETAEITKSYFFLKEIPIFQKDSLEGYNSKKFNISSSFNDLLSTTYTLGDMVENYKLKFHKVMFQNISQYTTGIVSFDEDLASFIRLGYKITIAHFFELLNFVYERGDSLGTRRKVLYNYKFREVNEIVRNVIRPINMKLKEYIHEEYHNFVDETKLIDLSFLIVLSFLICCVYLFVWRRHEAKLRESFSSSIGLLNIIPDEMKKQIVLNVFEEEKEK